MSVEIITDKKAAGFRPGIDRMATFINQFLKNPNTVGSICASSQKLAEEMLAKIKPDGSGLIIDLGAGTGSISAMMLQCGIPKERIIAVESLGSFSESFAGNCPGLKLEIADARNLRAVLNKAAPNEKICAIVSSLPFRAFGPKLSSEILSEIHRTMEERGGFLVQYSYAWWLTFPLSQYSFTPLSGKMVWRNLPPARVETYLCGKIEPSAYIAGLATENNDRFARLTAGIGRKLLQMSLGSIRLLTNSFNWLRLRPAQPAVKK